MRDKHVVHYGSIAGISYYNALALRQLGILSSNVIPTSDDRLGTDRSQSNRSLPFDQCLSSATSHRLVQLAQRGLFFARASRDASLIHFYGTTMLPRHLDTSLLRMSGKPMIISWAGGDARIIEWARKKNPFFYREPDPDRDRLTIQRLQKLGRTIRFAATDPEMAEYCYPFFERVFILRQPIDLAECALRVPRPDEDCPILLHIPTHREVKGTSYIEAAIKSLRKEGLRFEFRLLDPTLTQRQVRAEIASADIYVDELRCGSYGISAIEAMACGKPTVTYIREDLIDAYPRELPIVNANPETITDRLRELVRDPELRQRLGREGRQYAERFHSLEVIGPALLEIYRTIGHTA